MIFEITRTQSNDSPMNTEGANMEWAVGIMADVNYNESTFMRIVSRHGDDWNAADNACMKRNMMFNELAA